MGQVLYKIYIDGYDGDDDDDNVNDNIDTCDGDDKNSKLQLANNYTTDKITLPDMSSITCTGFVLGWYSGIYRPMERIIKISKVT